MALPISLGECLELVDRGIKTYNKIKHEVPELVADVADRVETLKLYLKRLRAFIQSNNALVSIRPAEVSDLENILSKLKTDMSKVIRILDKWKNNEGPGGIEWKFKFVAQTLFALGSSPKDLEDLGQRLDKRQDEMRDWMHLLLLWGQAEMLTITSLSKSQPSPAVRTDYNIVFIDADNESKSVVAEAYALLCRQWTTRTGGVWRVNTIHSAGLFVKARSETIDLQQQLGMTCFNGNKSPINVAMAALFDDQHFNYTYKDDIRKTISQRHSRGLTKNLFAAYDFILVFKHHDLACLENLRDALATENGQGHQAGKARLVLLGEYGTTKSKQIYKPYKDTDGQESLENWKATVSNIKTSFKNFMKQELGWIQPPPAAKQIA